jgi:UDP-N-acetylglucosamine 2-epimerase (non-hydrolysing)
MKRFISVVGARPNFMKIAPLHRAFQKYSDTVQNLIVHTGQHYDERMSKVFFSDLELPHPDFYLGVGSGSHAQQTAKVMTAFETTLLEQKPDLVIVVGDVNSTLACSVTSSKLGIPVAHVEAGLRSFDRGMPEEINRMVTDVLADHLFVSEVSGLVNLKNEGVDDSKVHFVGNVMIDSLIHYREKASHSSIFTDLGLKKNAYTLVTLHRPSNVDDKDNLEKILTIFEGICHNTTLVFPIHPRTRDRIAAFGLQERFDAIPNLIAAEPIGYYDFLALMDNSSLIVTDSGGIQEESTYLQVPCLTLRENTERPSTIEIGTNELMGLAVEPVIARGLEILGGNLKKGGIPEKWDGKTAERIAEILTA